MRRPLLSLVLVFAAASAGRTQDASPPTIRGMVDKVNANKNTIVMVTERGTALPPVVLGQRDGPKLYNGMEEITNLNAFVRAHGSLDRWPCELKFRDQGKRRVVDKLVLLEKKP